LLLAVAPLAVVVPLAAGGLLMNLSVSSREKEPLTVRVARRDFHHAVSVQGEVESAVNVEVRCEVHSESSNWIRILEVVPEATMVKPGDFLVRLDSSGLEADREQQKIVCAQAEAALVQARSRYEAAGLSSKMYLNDEFKLAQTKARLDVMVAADAERRAKEFFECSRKLEVQGYITELQLRADEYAWKAARTDLSTARIKLAVLENFTRPVRMTQLQAAVITAKARLAAAECHYNLSRQRLAFIQEQIGKCMVRAHVSGQVVLAHMFHFNHAHMIEPGEMTLEKRVLVRLPDFRRMQVAAKIEEDKIALVRQGLAATVRLEAFPGVTLRGRVTKINDYPEAEDWMGSSVKQYKTIVAIDASPSGTRPGMSADVTIHLNRLENRLQVPCPAVIRHGEKNYCIGHCGDRFEAREVSLGPNNGMNVVIREGLREGDEVVLAAAAYRDKVELPELKRPAMSPRSLTASVHAGPRQGLHD
jgi:multidrug efflux pump subunit AcrA (membrane-fusion protein)